MSITSEEVDRRLVAVEQRIDQKFDKLIDASTSTTKSIGDLSSQISVLVAKFESAMKDSERLERNQIEQGKRVNEHRDRIVVLETRQQGIVSLALKITPIIFSGGAFVGIVKMILER